MTPVRHFVILFLVTHVAAAQQGVNHSLTYDCRTLSLHTADEMAAGFEHLDMQRVDAAVTSVSNLCGISEVSLRAGILSAIVKGEPTSDDILLYLENGYHHRIRTRILNSRAIDFGYIYTDDESWYSYVPLRHRLDSVAANLAKDILNTETLTIDEKLICMLFAGDVDGFMTESGKKGLDDESVITNYRNNQIRDRARNGLAFMLYSGVYAPLGGRNVIGNNALVGFSFSSPVANKLAIEVGMKFRVHRNDVPFRYYAMGDTNVVNSDLGLFLGATAGYSLYDSKSWVVQARFGAGLESVDTGLSESSGNNSDETTYYDLTTVHLFTGIAIMKSISLKHYLGLGLNYHFCPYGLDTNLLTKLDTSALSAELFLRF